MSIQTNGILCNAKNLEDLHRRGLDSICFSIDSADAKEHDTFRNSPGAFEKTLNSVKLAIKTGLTTSISMCVSHNNLHSIGFMDMIKLSEKMGVNVFLNLAVPIGKWAGKWDVMMTEEDRLFINDLIKEKPFVRTDFDSTWVERGCSAIKEKAYITPYGDVLPCPFIQISYGNIRREKLREILVSALIKEPYYKIYHPICPAAEDRNFVEKFPCYNPGCSKLPVSIDEVLQYSLENTSSA